MGALPSVSISPRAASRVRAGHPWVHRADLVGDVPDGLDAVRVVDERGRALGCALVGAPVAPIALRIYARGEVEVPFSNELIADRLARAQAWRRRFVGDAECWRLAHAEADRLPGLFVDRWGDAMVVQTATAAMDRRERAIANILVEMGARIVVARDDGSARDHEGLARRKGVLAGDGATIVRVREGSAALELDLLEDAKTGGFLDQRENHARAGELASGQAIDAFSYHGGFALAIARRADHVLALDEDPRAVARARRNAELSGLSNVEARVADAFVELRELERGGRKFDLVVIDPPALAKRRGPIDAALRAYKELNLRGLRIAASGAWVVTCSCSGKVTAPMFEAMLVDAARDAKREVAIVERRGAARDHPVLLGVPETEYLKCFVLRVA